MGKIVANSDFFKSKTVPKAEPEVKKDAQMPDVDPAPVELDPAVMGGIHQSIRMLRDMEQPKLAQLVEQAYQTATKDHFTVAVVGEFSRGKSTFLNAFLKKDVLPVGNLPTTAMLTRIRYHEKPVLLCFDQAGNRRTVMPLTPDSCEGLVADDLTGTDPTGTALVGIDDPWLKKTNIELIDTPGAGDLEKSRAKVIGEALIGADGAIITISATQALSMSEKLFIEQRLIARKTPFLMLILTKLDQVPLAERCKVIDYVCIKLKNWGMDIPVFLPYCVELPDNRYQDVMGMDKVKAHILSWLNAPMRVELTQQWLIARTLSIVSTAHAALSEKKALLDADAQAWKEKILQKQDGLRKAEIAWEDLRTARRRRPSFTSGILCPKSCPRSFRLVLWPT